MIITGASGTLILLVGGGFDLQMALVISRLEAKVELLEENNTLTIASLREKVASKPYSASSPAHPSDVLNWAAGRDPGGQGGVGDERAVILPYTELYRCVLCCDVLNWAAGRDPGGQDGVGDERTVRGAAALPIGAQGAGAEARERAGIGAENGRRALRAGGSR
eukprot:2762557-Pyramimonas_sp.AAC.2